MMQETDIIPEHLAKLMILTYPPKDTGRFLKCLWIIKNSNYSTYFQCQQICRWFYKEGWNI